MKRLLILAFALCTLFSCGEKEAKVIARAVPERADDFVFENNLIAGRFYGKALEGNPTSPGIDIWVKLPGRLVADEWYAAAVGGDDPNYYHRDHGGKDCYKVAVSLGGGASAPFVEGKLRYPATNYRCFEMLPPAKGEESVSFVLKYPAWEASEGVWVSLDKQVTVRPDTYFCEVVDTWSFTGADSLEVAAGIKLHTAQQTVEQSLEMADRYAIWEKASDQSVEPEDGMIGVAVVMEEADRVQVLPEEDHALLVKKVVSGEQVRYAFGSCWSKGEVGDASGWFDIVRNVNN